MTILAHNLYRQVEDGFEPLGKLTVPPEHWLTAPSWLEAHPKAWLDFDNHFVTEVRDLTGPQVKRLCGPSRYTLTQRLLYETYEQEYNRQFQLLNSLRGSSDLFTVTWTEYY